MRTIVYYTNVDLLCIMIIDTDNLKTASSYAKALKISRFRVYQMVKEAKIAPIIIDGVLFVNDPKKKNETDT